HEQIELFLESLKNKPIVKQKQKLVIGSSQKLKPSSKILERRLKLLDTNDLRELAHSMNDPNIFKVKVEAAVTKITAGSIAAKHHLIMSTYKSKFQIKHKNELSSVQ
ncbi:9491_t:CDS:2, partial [Ambispora gerdemannii]